jgi:hypothetical protein
MGSCLHHNNNSIVIIIIIKYIDNIIIIIINNISIYAIREILSHNIGLYLSSTINLSHELPLLHIINVFIISTTILHAYI